MKHTITLTFEADVDDPTTADAKLNDSVAYLRTMLNTMPMAPQGVNLRVSGAAIDGKTL